MKYISNIVKASTLLSVSAMLVLSSCNKDLEQFATPVNTPPTDPSGLSLGATLAANADDSLYYRMVVKAGLNNLLANKTTYFTLFVPGNAAMRQFITAASGGLVPPGSPDAVYSGFIVNNLPAATANAIVSYNTIPQVIRTSSIPSTFPNFQYPSILNPAPAISALLRLTTFPSTANGAWVNNVPLSGVNAEAANGIIHHTAAVTTPPQRFLWDRINTDAQLTYLKAAINRADSGTASPGYLQGALSNIGANLTVFAPTDDAFKATITGAAYKVILPLVTQQLTALYISGGMTPADAATQAAIDAPPIALGQATTLASSPTVFSNPALYGVLTAENVKGILVYHLFGNRAFTNNFPTTPTAKPTLLNTVITAHPGVIINATFGTPFVTNATIKGAFNTTDANILINASPLTPDPLGTSDQHYTNGVLHKIDQVLLPAQL